MRLHNEAYGVTVQTNVESITENLENTGAVMSSKLIELRNSQPPALVEEILKLEAFKDIKQHIVSTTVTESQMTIKYLKDVSAMLAVVSAVRVVDLDHINYARHNKYQHVYLNNLLRREKSIAKDLITNGYNGSSSGGSFSTIHWDLAAQYLNKETKGTVGSFGSGYIRNPYIHTVKKSTKNYSWSRNW